jgi:superfamily II DNA or RNA helicase
MSSIVISVTNIASRLLTADQKVKDKLSDLLRRRPKNFWHNPMYNEKKSDGSRKWDGWKYFFDKKSGMFLTGILPEVELALKHMRREYAVEDQRTPFVWATTSIGQDFLNDWLPKGFDPIELHDFQPDLVNQAIRYGRGIVKAPTGAGKTFILISLLKCLPPKTPTLFLTKNRGLVHQNWKEMKLWGVENLGRWYDKFKEPNYVTCATIHKATFESLEKLLPKFRAVIVDEVHDAMSPIPQRAYRKMSKAAVRIGISATPFRYDKKKIDECHKWLIKSHFGPVFLTNTTETGELTTADLQDRGILSKSRCFFYPIDKPDLRHEPYANAVKLGIEQNFHFHDIVARLAKTCPGRTLIVVERIEQGEYLNQLIPGSEFIQGKVKLKDRDATLEKMLKGGRATAIVMKQIITAGINVKIHDLINAAGGEAAQNMIQLLGRGLRTADDKDMLRYHDFHFQNNDYLRKHAEWRMEVIEQERHELVRKESVDF